MEDFPTGKAYCKRLKLLADQLANVDALVSNTRFFLKMIAGLTDAYVDFVTYIQQHDPLPPFETAKSRLQLKESTILLRATRESGSSSSTTSLVANSQNFDDDMNRQNSSQGIHNNNNNHRNRGNKNNKNLGGQNSGRGGRGSSDDGFSGGQGAGSGNRGQQQQ